jgi:predicted small metal-binding protein
MGSRQWVDPSPLSSLAGCDCGWRELAHDKPDAWRRAWRHAQSVHDGDNANTMRNYYRTRG